MREHSSLAFQLCVLYAQMITDPTVVCRCAFWGWHYLCFGKRSCFQSCTVVNHV